MTYKRSQILISCGGKHSFYNLAQALFDRGDEVIIPAPYWVSYPPMVALAEATPVIIETKEENGFRVTPEELKKAREREYYFGSLDEYHMQLGRAEHVVLNPPQSGAPLLYFMYPYAEVDGKPLNEDLFGYNIGYKITFKE